MPREQGVVDCSIHVSSLPPPITFDSELVEEYRSFSKEIKQLRKKLESLEEESKQQTLALGVTR